MSYPRIYEALQQDPSIHNWVKEALTKLEDKDIVDVLNGLEVLTMYFEHKHAGLVASYIERG